MQYKTIFSDIIVSRICFGTLPLGYLQLNINKKQGGKLIAYALERGINFFDTAQLYETYGHIKDGLRGYNKPVVISTKTYAYTRQMAIDAVEQARTQLDRDVIDIFKLHEQESVHTLNGHKEALDYLYECKEKGIIRAVGASMHTISAVYGAIEKNLDVILPILNINGLGINDGDRTEMENALKQAKAQGLGIFAMKPLGGGNLYHNADSCLRYIFDLPYIDSVAIGMKSESEINANISFLETGSFGESEKDIVNSEKALHIADWCERCGQCVKRCPVKALEIVNDKLFCDKEKCVTCGYCSTACKLFCLKIY